MDNVNVHIEKLQTLNDPELKVLSPMVEEAFALTMEACPDEAKGLELPKGEDLAKGFERGMDIWKIFCDGKPAGGAIVSVKDENTAFLELLFIGGRVEGKGIGVRAWYEMEKAYPGVRAWETVTPCFQKRNIHFYVNKCGFHIVAYHSKWNPIMENGKPSDDEMFAFRKEV